MRKCSEPVEPADANINARERFERILLLCYFDPIGEMKSGDEISRIFSYSCFPVTVINLYDCQNTADNVFLPALLNLDAFDSIIFHESIIKNVKHYQSIDHLLTKAFRDFGGAKVLFLRETGWLSSADEAYFQKIGCHEFLFPLTGSQGTDDFSREMIVKFDSFVEERMRNLGRARIPDVLVEKPAKNIILLVAQEPHIDPRLTWMARHAPEELRVVIVGVDPSDSSLKEREEKTSQQLVFSMPRKKWTGEWIAQYVRCISQDSGMAAVCELSFMERALQTNEEQFCTLFDAPHMHARNVLLRCSLQYFLDTTETLIAQVMLMKNIHGIIAADLDTLPAALFLKGILDVPVYYDAHEYWPESDTLSCEYEQIFWRGLEKRLVRYTDFRVTVSSGLAELMSSQYENRFDCLPNCEPVQKVSQEFDRSSTRQLCNFIFQGGFAPYRGLELLIDVWPDTDENAVLLLRGPDNSFKESLVSLARKTGLLGKRIFFPEAVGEPELVRALADGDVGLIPYVPHGKNHLFCCPNKMSQYMAAQLPILANDTVFVRQIVEEANAGIVVDFGDRSRLIEAVSLLTNDSTRRLELGANALRYQQQYFNWQQVSKAFYEAVTNQLAGIGPSGFQVFGPTEPRPLYLAPHIPAVLVHNIEKNVAGFSRRVWDLLPAPVRHRVKPVLRPVVQFVRKTCRQ